MGTGGISSDEEDEDLSAEAGVSTYAVRRRNDRSEELEDCNTRLDEAFVLYLKPTYNFGSPVHVRIRGIKDSPSDHPVRYHHPENTYARKWLDELPLDQRQNLGATPPIDFAKAIASIFAGSGVSSTDATVPVASS